MSFSISVIEMRLFFVDVVIPGSIGGLGRSLLVGVLPDRAGLYQLVTRPLLPVIDGSVLRIGDDLVCPVRQVIQLGQDFPDLDVG